MGLECVMIVMDNSAPSRNGDVIPNRFQAQLDTIGSLVSYKTNDNPETSVGLLTMGGTHVTVRSTPSNEPSKIYSTFSQIALGGKSRLAHSLLVA